MTATEKNLLNYNFLLEKELIASSNIYYDRVLNHIQKKGAIGVYLKELRFDEKRFKQEFLEEKLSRSYQTIYQTKSNIHVWSDTSRSTSYSSEASREFTLVPILLDLFYVKRSGQVVPFTVGGVVKGRDKDRYIKHICQSEEALIQVAKEIVSDKRVVISKYRKIYGKYGTPLKTVGDASQYELLTFTDEKEFKKYVKVLKGKEKKAIDYKELADKSAEGKGKRIVERLKHRQYNYVEKNLKNVAKQVKANMLYHVNDVVVYEMRGKNSRLIVSNTFAYIEYYADGRITLLYDIEKGSSLSDAEIVAKKLNNKLVAFMVSLMDLRRHPLTFFDDVMGLSAY